ncbi:MAG: FecR domain-containing protein [Chitinophaga sp.]|uniref:FecR family protein n=1 Tax=Chitinophaga sp. TaxID=1869181 RepID=UPI001B1344D8|nr:FecR domain-containing protein [Chitinophaga sp.]MBO9730671.1 FecR domain-containing protein [Chitinophaga sp.]
MDKQLLEKYFKGDCTEQEVITVEGWLNGGDTPLLDEFMMEQWQAVNEPVVMAPKIYRRWYGAAAAAVLGAIAVATFFWQQQRIAPRPVAVKWDTLSNKTSNIQLFTMTDGSEVWLNAHSAVICEQQYNKTKRELWLNGEAYFKVVKDDQRPFLVHTGSITTTVLGTSFNIATANKADGSIQVSLVEGKVAVSMPDNADKILLPGQMLQYAPGKDPQLLAFADNEVLDWKKGKIYFDNTLLADALAKLQQRYGCKIVLEEKRLARKKISGEFSRDMPLESILSTLEYVHNLAFVQADDSTFHARSKK